MQIWALAGSHAHSRSAVNGNIYCQETFSACAQVRNLALGLVRWHKSQFASILARAVFFHVATEPRRRSTYEPADFVRVGTELLRHLATPQVSTTRIEAPWLLLHQRWKGQSLPAARLCVQLW